MKLLSILTTTLVLLIPQSQTTLVDTLNLNFENNAGSATVSRAKFQLDGQEYDFTNTTFDVTSNQGVLTIESPKDNFSYALNVALINGVSKATLTNVSAEVSLGLVSARVPSARLEKDAKTTEIDNFTLNCRANNRMSDAINACVNLGQLNLGRYFQDSTDLRDAKVSIQRGKLTFEVKVAGIGKINGNGSVTHDEAGQIIAIRIDKVKYGILDITGRFFSMVADLESDSVKVARPNIFVSYQE